MLALDPIDSLVYVYPKNENWKHIFRDISELCCEKIFVLLSHVFSHDVNKAFGIGILSADTIIDSHGDAISDIPNKKHPHDLDGHGNILSCDINTNFIAELNMYHSAFKSNNIKMYMLFPVYPYEEYIINHYQINTVYHKLVASAKFDILGHFDDFLLPVDMFTDTVHHISFAGKRVRTDKLIQILTCGNYL
jgi:hypothetical protein